MFTFAGKVWQSNTTAKQFITVRSLQTHPLTALWKHLLILFKDNYTEIKDQIKIRDVIDQKGGER